jgi:hypothetical protein
MSAEDANLFLQRAEELDGYLTAIQKSSVNRKAREGLPYAAWNDQGLAEQARGLLKGAELVIVSPNTEGGMPHTRAPNIICLPAYWPLDRLKSTLHHELIHISQREYPAAWEKTLLNEGWSKVSEEELPAEWVARCRINPDTFAARWWAWEGRYVPMPLFVREDRPNLRDIDVRWWDRQTGRLNPAAPASFVRKYGDVPASHAEHPYELWAYTLEQN